MRSWWINTKNVTDNLGYVVAVLIVSAGLLAFVVQYNLSNINITERTREIATLKVLGFYDGEVSAYIYRESVILTILGTDWACCWAQRLPALWWQQPR